VRDVESLVLLGALSTAKYKRFAPGSPANKFDASKPKSYKDSDYSPRCSAFVRLVWELRLASLCQTLQNPPQGYPMQRSMRAEDVTQWTLHN
jgi:hypothetical protein